MTLHQGFSFAIVAAMLGMFLWDRWRFDVVALLALMAAVAAGIVPMDKAFTGFINPVVIIIASALVLSRAVAAAGVGAWLLRRLSPIMTTDDRRVGVLCLLVTSLSTVVKNVGALAIFMPVAFQLEQQGEGDRRRYLMPMSFGSLAGGMVSLIGTSPNLLISSVRQETLGQPYAMFDFAAVGVPLACFAVLFLTFGWRLIPKRERPAGAPSSQAPYAAELRIRKGSPLIGKRLADFERLAGGDVAVARIIREGGHRYVPSRDWTLYVDDILLVEGEAANLQSLVEEARLELVPSEEGETGQEADPKKAESSSTEIGTVEVVVGEGSDLIGTTARRLRLRDRYHINLMAISRRGRRVEERLQQTPFQIGDLLIVEGDVELIPETMAGLGCLALVERGAQLGPRRPAWPAVIVLAASAALAASRLIPVEIAFFAGAVAIVVFRLLPLREAYAAIDWPVVVLLGCLIPVGEAVHATGGSELIAHGLAALAAGLSPPIIIGLLLVIAMLVTPILHHAAAVLVLGPIAASLAVQLGYRADGFLMAVAVGASCDFLTPIGHQCNALVMGPGRYRFGDYWHLGLPLSVGVVLLGVPLIGLAWPQH